MQLPLVSLRDAGRLLHRRLLGKVTVQNTVCMKSMPTALLKVVKGKSGANKTFWIHRPAAQVLPCNLCNVICTCDYLLRK